MTAATLQQLKLQSEGACQRDARSLSGLHPAQGYPRLQQCSDARWASAIALMLLLPVLDRGSADCTRGILYQQMAAFA